MKKYLYFFCVMILLTLPTQLTAQIRADFMIVTDTTSLNVMSDVTIDEEENWHFVWESDYRIKYSILNRDGEVIKKPCYITQEPEWLWNIEILARKDHAVIVSDEGLHVGGKGIVGKVISLKADSIIATFSVPIIYESASFIDAAFVNDSTLFILFTDYGAGFNRESFCLQQVSISGEIIDECSVVDNESPATYYPIGLGRIVFNPQAPHFLVVWEDQSSGSSQIYGKFYSQDGETSSERFNITDSTDNYNIWANKEDMDVDGNFIVAWGAQSDSTWNVYTRHFNADGIPNGITKKVNQSNDAGMLPCVDISIDSDGKYIVAWNEEDSKSGYIYAQRFTKDGSPIGDNFKIPTDDVNSQKNCPIIFLRNNRIYTTWADNRPPGKTNKYYSWANILDFDNPTEVSISKHQQNTPQLTTLENYPNPFNSQTMITYELLQQAHVNLTIYDILGKEVLNLIDEYQSAGIHRIIWNGQNKNGTDVTSGVYFVLLKNGRMLLTKKLLLLR